MGTNLIKRFVEESVPDCHPDGVPFLLGQRDLFAVRSFDKTPLEPVTYEPMAALVLQGTKIGFVGDRETAFEAGRCVIISHEMPLTARISAPSNAMPFLSLIFLIDLAILRRIDVKRKAIAERTVAGGPFLSERPESRLIEALQRYIQVSKNPLEKSVLSDGLREEIHLRLLEAPNGRSLVKLLDRDSNASGVQRAIEFIIKNFATNLSIDQIASEARLGTSTLFTSFKDYTGQTPMQYVRAYRLNQACRMLRYDKKSVASAAFSVGYKSLPQFSRDFKAHFGTTPSSFASGKQVAQLKIVNSSVHSPAAEHSSGKTLP